MLRSKIIGYRRDGRPIRLIQGASDDGQQDGTQQDGTQQQDSYPPGVPVGEMAPEQQAAYWKAQARKHEGRARERSDYDRIKARLAELESTSATAAERAAQETQQQMREQLRAEARSEIYGDAAAAVLRGALAVRGVPADKVESQVRYVNTAAFVNDDGVDTEAVMAYVSTVVPATGAVDYGAGARGSSRPLTGREAGTAEAERRGYLRKTS